MLTATDANGADLHARSVKESALRVSITRNGSVARAARGMLEKVSINTTAAVRPVNVAAPRPQEDATQLTWSHQMVDL